MIDISIEVTTYNRKEVLRDLLLRLASQTCPVERFEVVLSDDGSTDGLLEMVEEMVSSLPYKLTLLRHVHQGPGHGHNRGIEACPALNSCLSTCAVIAKILSPMLLCRVALHSLKHYPKQLFNWPPMWRLKRYFSVNRSKSSTADFW